MSNTSFLKALSFGALFFTATSFAQNITILNHNFEHDAIPPSPGWTTYITGWVDSGLGEIGVFAPEVNDIEYIDMGGRAQVAYLNNGGRISQTANVSLLENETYTLIFDVGQQQAYSNPHFVARIKSNGETLAQLQSDSFEVPNGNWATYSFSVTASTNMPIGNSLVVEFQNLSNDPKSQINLDNVKLNIAGTGTTTPGGNLGPLTMIMEDTTLLVPGQYPNIHMALKYLDDKHIKVGKTVTIQVTDCSNQVYSESINVAHHNGDSIHITGDADNPESCVLQFNGANGFEVSGNFELGMISGFHIVGDRTANSIGIFAEKGAKIDVGNGVNVSNFELGFSAQYSGIIIADNTKSYDNISHGYFTYLQGLIRAHNSESYGNINGYSANRNSTIEANYSSSHHNSSNGFFTAGSSYLVADFAISSDNKNGFRVHRASEMFAWDSVAKNNSSSGFEADYLSLMDADRASSYSNGTNYSPAIHSFGNKNAYMHH